jgi:hypothetical protein
MKIPTLVILCLIFSLINSKESTKLKKIENTNSKSTQIGVRDRMPDSMDNAFVHNDPYVLQHQAVIFFILICYTAGFQKSSNDGKNTFIN